MLNVTSIEQRIGELNRQIDHILSTAAQVKRSRAPFEKRADVAVRRLRSLNCRKWLRAPSKSYVLWKIGVLLVLVVPLVVFGLSFLIRDAFSGSFSVAPILCAIAGISAGGLLAKWLYFPNDAQLAVDIADTDVEFRMADADLQRVRSSDGLSDLQKQISSLLDERRQLQNLLREQRREQQRKLREEIAALGSTRAKLIQRDWKSLRAYEWEQYLVEVFLALGASKAERIGGAGDQGVDLIVEMSGNKIAVQAKGYDGAVTNKAVQEVHSGMVHHRCCACVVITNSRFTKGARELALSTNCILIGEDKFIDFVSGKMEIC